MDKALVDTTRMSDKGQIVIPRDIREKLGLKVGSKFLVFAEKDVIILQNVEAIGEKIKVRELLERARSITGRLGFRK